MIREKISTSVHREVLERDANQCVCCGYWKDLEIHHIEGYADMVGGGKSSKEANKKENLVCICYICHIHVPFPQTKENFEKYKETGGAGLWLILGRTMMLWKAKDPKLIKFSKDQLIDGLLGHHKFIRAIISGVD